MRARYVGCVREGVANIIIGGHRGAQTMIYYDINDTPAPVDLKNVEVFSVAKNNWMNLQDALYFHAVIQSGQCCWFREPNTAEEATLGYFKDPDEQEAVLKGTTPPHCEGCQYNEEGTCGAPMKETDDHGQR